MNNKLATVKKWTLVWVIVLASFSGRALFAQDVTGTWQGTLQTPARSLRVVFKISQSNDGKGLQAFLYNIDQGPISLAGSTQLLLPISTVSVGGATVKMAVPGIGATYDGTLSGDGNLIKGTWTQGPGSQPLNLARATAETAWAIPEPPSPVKPMAADADPFFEVAAIKLSRPDEPGRGFHTQGQQFTTTNTSLSDLITWAYDLPARQISGGPAWMGSEKYDLLAEFGGEGKPNEQQKKIMLQKLITDRFKLAFHREKQELSVYAIVVGKTGPKLTPSTGDPNGTPGLIDQGLGALSVRNATMADFANHMQGVLDRQIMDQTGLTGKYDFMLKWTPDESQYGGRFKPPAPTDDPNAPPDLFTATQEQLGLRLESTKAPVDVLVIDHADHPSPN